MIARFFFSRLCDLQRLLDLNRIINPEEMDMKSISSAITVAVLALFASYSTFAQTPAPTREQVKKEAAQAMKSDKIECGEMEKDVDSKSTKKRADVKKEAAAAKLECGNVPKPMTAKSTKKRADVKKEAAEAVKEGAIPTGDQPVKK